MHFHDDPKYKLIVQLAEARPIFRFIRLVLAMFSLVVFDVLHSFVPDLPFWGALLLASFFLFPLLLYRPQREAVQALRAIKDGNPENAEILIEDYDSKSFPRFSLSFENGDVSKFKMKCAVAEMDTKMRHIPYKVTCYKDPRTGRPAVLLLDKELLWPFSPCND